MMGFPVFVYTYESEEDDGVPPLYREIELPFPPSVGMSVADGEWQSEPFEDVVWDIERQRFEVITQDGAKMAKTVPTGELKEALLAAGWKEGNTWD